MRFSHVLVYFILIVIANPATAQKIIQADREYHFTNYSIEEGLNVPSLNSFYQDSKGNIWICGRAGVAKFDGINFVNYSEAEGLPSGGAGSVCEDKYGNIWFGTWKGLAVLKNNKFYLDTSEGMPRRLSWGLFTDTDGTIWSANHLGLFHINPYANEKKVIKHYTYSDAKDASAFRTVFRKKNGQLIAGGEYGCFTLEKDSLVRYVADGISVYTFIEFEDGREWASGWAAPIYQIRNNKIDSSINLGTIVLGMVKDKSGNIFLATWDKGIFKYDGKNFTQFTIKNGLPINSFWTNFCDKEGNIWFGSWGEGVSRYSGSMFTKFTEKSGLLNNVLHSLQKDNAGNIWMGSQNGFTKYNPVKKTTEVFEVSIESNDLYSEITKMLVVSENEVWGLGYSGAGIKLKKNKIENAPGLTGNIVFHDSKNRFWRAAEGSLALCDESGKALADYHAVNDDAPEKFSSIYEDFEGNFWVTGIRGINYFDGSKMLKFTQRDGFLNKSASAIVQYQSNRYFLAIPGRGIFNYYFNSGKFKLIDSLTEKEGLQSGTITSMRINNDMVYMAGVRGLSVFNLKEYRKGKKIVKTYSDEEGLTGKFCNIGFIDSVGGVWIYSNKGAFRFDPNASFNLSNETQINITGIKMFYEKADWSVYSDSVINEIPLKLELPYNKNHLTFAFTGISFSAPNKVRYKYKLEGYDKSWSPPRKVNEATYSNISPGTYTFMVIASNRDGEWNKIPAVFTFVIHPPFWKTGWFLISITLFIIFALYFFIRYREKKLQAANAQLEKKINERTIELKVAYDEIEEKQKEVMDSIRYAKRIQNSLLASEKYIHRNISRLMPNDKKDK